MVATGVVADGTREVLGVDVGDSEDEAFWTAFLRGLRRGLVRVQLVISDAHEGLKAAVARVLSGSGWQRSSVNMGSVSMSGGGERPLVTSAVGRGPWQRDHESAAADPSLPAVAGLDWPVGVVLRAPG